MRIEIGTTISHYKIVGEIASGGMGHVYLAEDLDLDRKVAIKFLKSRYASDDEYRQRFLREAQAAASLHHPNIVTIHEVSQYRDTPFIVMEYVSGTSVGDLIDQGPMDPQQVTDIIIQVCRGLEDAHRTGMVHRDIKPANIMLDDSGRVRILDFGLARTLGLSQLSAAETRAGTVYYMSPEQVRGEDLTPSSDLFSLGALAYQMLTGKLPFSGEYEASVAYAIVNVAPQPLSESCPDLPEAIVHIVERLLEKNSDERYQQASEIIADLDTDREAHPDKRRFSLKPVAFIAVAVAVIVAGWKWLYQPPEPIDVSNQMLAVLPFENLGPAEDEYFADGITDAVTLRLAKFCDIGVISRQSSMQYKGSRKPLGDIGAELGAAYLLTGTVHWDKAASNRVRINASLVRASDDRYLWTESYIRVLEGIFDLQSEIADRVTRELNIAVDESRRRQMTDVPTRNLEAYDLYLRGNEYFNRSWDREDIEIAVGMYEKAIALDSGFAAAWAMLSRGYASMYWEYYDRSDSMRQMAIDAARKSLQLEENLVEGYLALGYCYYHCGLDYEQALAQFSMGLSIEPTADLYNAVAAVQRRQGNLEQSAHNFLLALQLDPRSHLKAFDVGLTYGMMRQYRLAEKFVEKTIALAPDYPLAYIYRAWLPILREGNVAAAKTILNSAAGRADLTKSIYYWWILRIVGTDEEQLLPEITAQTDTIAYYIYRARAYRLSDDQQNEKVYADSARQILEVKLLEHPEDARFHSYLGLAYAGLGMKEPAIAHGMKAAQLLPASKEAFDAPFLLMNLAETFMIFGEYDAAVEQIEFVLSIPGLFSASYLRLDPLWRPMHGHPGFEQLLQSSV